MINLKQTFGNLLFYLLYPGLYILLSKSHRTRVIIQVDEKVLFVNNWLGDKRQSLPGGGIKSGEKSIKAAIREVYEETGLTLDEMKLKPILKDQVVRDTGIKYYVDLYHVKLTKIMPTKSMHVEILRSDWEKWSEKINSKDVSNTTSQLLQAWRNTENLLN